MRVCKWRCVVRCPLCCQGCLGIVYSGGGSLDCQPQAWENLPFPEPRSEAQGNWRKRRSSFPPSRPFGPIVPVGSHRAGGGEALGGARRAEIPLSQSQFVQGGCGTFQRRLGGVCVAGQAWGGFRHRENGIEVHSQRGHRGGGPDAYGCRASKLRVTLNLSSLISS